MLTQRGWWLLLVLGAMLFFGIRVSFPLISLIAFVSLTWLCQEWLRFVIASRAVVSGLKLDREVRDSRGGVSTLWVGRTFDVSITLISTSRLKLDHVLVEDAVPFSVERFDGSPFAQGPLQLERPIDISYRVRCNTAGCARFEGVLVRMADLQGLFYHRAFVRSPVLYRILPVLTHRRAAMALTKRANELPPPGVHRHRRPGSGSELLDLRDYLPGDPPKTIAWKISARRDRLITKEFESEVPIRCTLFVDASASVRVAALAPPALNGNENWRPMRAIDRLVEIAAGVAQANAATRDLTVLCLFDENKSEVVKPDRTGPHLTQMLNRLADAAGLEPATTPVVPDDLVPLAYAFADRVYPDLLSAEVNGMSWWATYFGNFPAYRQRRGTFWQRLYRSRLLICLVGGLGLPLLFILIYAAAVAGVIFAHKPQDLIAKTIGRGLVISTFFSAVSLAATLFFFVAFSLFGEGARRERIWRKRLAALLVHQYGPAAGGVSALLEDEMLLSLRLQRFLADHRVPYSLPLYDEAGKYLFGAPGKISVLATAIVQAVSRGRDNELFVILADVLELDQDIAPLMRAVKVALGRHHQVLFICPWPPALPLPDTEGTEDSATWVIPSDPNSAPLPPGLGSLTTERLQAAYARIRHSFGSLGVQVVCAASEHPIALILDRIDRLRRVRRVH